MNKTPEEIKKGLACAIDGCMEPGVCEVCPYNIEYDVMCHVSAIAKDALTYIEQMEERINLMMIQIRGDCGVCKHGNVSVFQFPCDECMETKDHDLWEYEGLPEVKEG